LIASAFILCMGIAFLWVVVVFLSTLINSSRRFDGITPLLAGFVIYSSIWVSSSDNIFRDG
jgi:hypothetical protein